MKKIQPMQIIHPGFERSELTATIETGPYTVGQPVAELKAHLTPQNNPCNIRRGTITAVFNQRESAQIQCDCGTVVAEST